MITQFYGLSVSFSVFWKSGVALGVALGVSLLLRKRSADVRRLVLSTAVVAMFVAAAALPMLPRWILVTPLRFQVQRHAVQAVPERASDPAIIHDELTVADAQLPAAQPVARAQAAAQTAKFDVASIKPCAPGDITAKGGGRGGAGRINWSPGRLRAECQTVEQLIREAYLRYLNGKLWPTPLDPRISERLLAAPIKGSPAWAASDRYTIEAEADGTPDEAITRGPMLQALLEDRFKLRVHSESREIPVYELTVASGGPKLKPAQEGSCIPWGERLTATPRPAPEERTAANMPCGLFIRSPRNEGLDVNGTTMAHLCRNFSAVLDRDVVDKTGVEGLFDIYLDIPPEPRPADDAAGPGPSTPSGRPDPERTFAAAKAALQKLGLRLEAAKAAGQFLVIDHVERPSEN